MSLLESNQKIYELDEGATSEPNKYYYYLKQCLKFICKYSIRSCPGLKSCQCYCGQCDKSQSDPKESEMVDYPPSITTSIQHCKQADVKEAVNYHYKDHIQKWKRQKFPWKVIFHISLIILVTIQVS